MTAPILVQPQGTYWHFLPESGCLRYGDGRKVMPGETLRVDKAPSLCEVGLHASRRAIDALSFAPGPIVCLVTLGGAVLDDPDHAIPDKSVGQERTALWIYDASRLLRGFACDVAEAALLAERKAGREPDARSFAAIEVMRRFMAGNASESERSAAYLAAYLAARSAADSAADSAFNDRLTQMLLGAMQRGDGEFAPATNPFDCEVIAFEKAGAS